jgi:hypothetical protein
MKKTGPVRERAATWRPAAMFMAMVMAMVHGDGHGDGHDEPVDRNGPPAITLSPIITV